MAQQRTPAGTRTGGQYASSVHAEADAALVPFYPHGQCPECGRDTGAGDGCVHCDDTTTSDAEWADAGVTDPAKIRVLNRRGHDPSSFESPDRDVRLSACSARGDLVFEGELLSDAYAMSNHCDDPKNQHRMLHPPTEIRYPTSLPEAPERWSSMPADEKLAYIDGYAAGIDAIERAKMIAGPRDGGRGWATITMADRGPRLPVDGDKAAWERNIAGGAARRAGWNRAVTVQALMDAADDGQFDATDAAVTISRGDSPEGALELHSVRKAPEPDRPNGPTMYEGRVTGTHQRRWNSDGETKDRFVNSRVLFDGDAFLDAKAGGGNS